MSETPQLNYVDYSFDNLVVELQNNLATHNSWHDTYKSATGQMLIELFAAVGSLVLYYIERRAEESYIATAKNYSSVVNLARLLNYIPRRPVSATGNLRFSLEEAVVGMVFVPKWTIVSTASGVKYLTTSESVIMPGQTEVDVSGIQGIVVTTEYSSAGTPSQTYTITDTFVENTQLFIYVNDILWTQVTSFINSVTTSTHYVLRAELDGTVTIVFGDGSFGKSPALNDTIKLEYIQSLGLGGNVYVAGLVNVVDSEIYDEFGDPQTLTVENTSTFLGGDDAETIEDIRTNAPLVFATGDRLVTKGDFVAVIGDYPGVADVNVWGEKEEPNPDYNHFNQVKICLVLQNWALSDPTFENTLSDYLYLKSIMTVRYTYIPPVILDLVPTLEVKAKSGTALSYLQSRIDAAIIERFTLGTTTQLGVNVYHSDIVALIEAVSGVNYSHTILKIRKELTAAYDLAFDWGETMDALPLVTTGVDLYLDSTRIAVDNGSGDWISLDPGITVIGSIDYNTGKVVTTITPAPNPVQTVYCRYQQDTNSDIIVGLNQIVRYVETDYLSLS
jgi:hypothetical protein